MFRKQTVHVRAIGSTQVMACVVAANIECQPSLHFMPWIGMPVEKRVPSLIQPFVVSLNQS